MEIHSRDMQVTSIQAINPDKVRVTLSDVQSNPGGGPGAGPAGMGAGAGFTYEIAKDQAPKAWDVQTITVSA